MPFKDYEKRLKHSKNYYHTVGKFKKRNQLKKAQARYGSAVTEDMVGRTGICTICLRHRKLVIDHDHDTGEIRGLICRTCNTGIGHLMDDPITLQRALDYLRGVRAQHF